MISGRCDEAIRELWSMKNLLKAPLFHVTSADSDSLLLILPNPYAFVILLFTLGHSKVSSRKTLRLRRVTVCSISKHRELYVCDELRDNCH